MFRARPGPSRRRRGGAIVLGCWMTLLVGTTTRAFVTSPRAKTSVRTGRGSLSSPIARSVRKVTRSQGGLLRPPSNYRIEPDCTRLQASVSSLSSSWHGRNTTAVDDTAFLLVDDDAVVDAGDDVLFMPTTMTTKTTTTKSTTTGDRADTERTTTGLGQGIRRDVTQRLASWSTYKSDLVDGCNGQTVAAVGFLLFACLAPAVGFGSLYRTATGGAMGTVEMLTSTALSGMLYATLAAQPLSILGSTGPILALTAGLARLAVTLGLPFLPLYAWTGLWTSVMLATLAVTNASRVVRHLTRFTDEVFGLLISLIFIVEAARDIGRPLITAGAGSTLMLSGTALWTLATAMTTYTVTSLLKQVRKSRLVRNKQMQKVVSNFAPTIGVAVACVVAHMAKRSSAAVALPTLVMPSTFGTTTGRPWLVDLFQLPVWARWAAALPAAMATVQLFLEQSITNRVVNHKKWRMTKGNRTSVVDGMHADLLLLAGLTAVQSVFGLPWVVAATVRSLSHVKALATFDNNAASESKKTKPTGVLEQRISGFAIHAIMACSVLLSGPRNLISKLPLPVLMGLFLYMGTSSLPGNEVWERLTGFFRKGQTCSVNDTMEECMEKIPRWDARRVPPRITRRLTAIQGACLAALWWVKSSRTLGVFFPVIIAMLAPLRVVLERSKVIPKPYMQVLDES